MHQHAGRVHKDEKIVLISEEEFRNKSPNSPKICSICNKLFQADATCKRHIQKIHHITDNQEVRKDQKEEEVATEPEPVRNEERTGPHPLLFVRIFEEFPKVKCEVMIPTSNMF